MMNKPLKYKAITGLRHISGNQIKERRRAEICLWLLIFTCQYGGDISAKH